MLALGKKTIFHFVNLISQTRKAAFSKQNKLSECRKFVQRKILLLHSLLLVWLKRKKTMDLV